MRISRILALGLLAGTTSCNGLLGVDDTVPPEATIALSYLDYVTGVMRANSINRLRIDWNAFTTSVYGAATVAKTIPETYPAIRVALTILGDGHSSYRGADGTVIFVPLRACTAPAPTRPALPANIGYVRVRSFSGSADAAQVFAQNLQDSIRVHDRDGLAGWIVDLRGNGGGNMWPMVAGIGPVLGEGTAGYFVDPGGVETAWEYRNGASLAGGTIVSQLAAAHRLKVENPRVVVLTDATVASSGEAVAVSFRKRPNTITLGTPTCGLSTSNRGFPLPDGGLLNLTTAVFADRLRVPYGDRLSPDEVIVDEPQLFQRAVAWLQGGA